MENTIGVPNHTPSFRGRRALIWLPFGLAFAFILTGKWNLQFGKFLGPEGVLPLDLPQIAMIVGIGKLVLFLSPIIAGIITDILGGRRTLLFAMGGIALSNALMGGILMGSIQWQWDIPLPLFFGILFAINMHFQSYAILSIVKIYARWFHVRERGGFATIFRVVLCSISEVGRIVATSLTNSWPAAWPLSPKNRQMKPSPDAPRVGDCRYFAAAAE